MNGEILYELSRSGPDAPQCCVCNQAAEHKCAYPKCGELLCPEDARACEFCDASQMPALKYCDAHAEEIEDGLYICEEHKSDFEAEMERVTADEMAYEEVMA